MNRKQPLDRRWIFILLLISMLAVDQAVKVWTRSTLSLHQSPGFPWPGVFEWTFSRNEGIAFGLAQGKGWLFTPIAILIAIAAGFYSWKHPKDGVWIHAAMGLLASGALGNLYDRVFFGYVTDMFWFRPINFPVFNWADTCITIATGILIITWTMDAFAKEKQAARSQQAAPAPASEDSL